MPEIQPQLVGPLQIALLERPPCVPRPDAFPLGASRSRLHRGQNAGRFGAGPMSLLGQQGRHRRHEPEPSY